MKAPSVKVDRIQTPAEEIANSVLHGAGALLSIVGLVILVVLASIAGDVWRIVSFSIYGATLIILYLSSTLYHSISAPRAKRVLKFLDHTSIYLLIAGTYTAISLTALRGFWGWLLFGLTWGLAIFGIILKVFFHDRIRVLEVVIYALMGWLCLIALDPMMKLLPGGLLATLVAGGVLYTVGIAFYAWKKLPWGHVIWHVFVLAGSLAHFFGILFYLAPTTA